MGLRPVWLLAVRRTDYSSANWTGELSLAIFSGSVRRTEPSTKLLKIYLHNGRVWLLKII